MKCVNKKKNLIMLLMLKSVFLPRFITIITNKLTSVYVNNLTQNAM